MSERYTVGSVTGFSPGYGGGRKPTTVSYVYDSAWCYRIVAKFWGSTKPERALAPARELARRLNEEEREWERSL